MSELATVEDSRNVIVIGDPILGVLAPSWRLKETLEILGYGVSTSQRIHGRCSFRAAWCAFRF